MECNASNVDQTVTKPLQSSTTTEEMNMIPTPAFWLVKHKHDEIENFRLFFLEKDAWNYARSRASICEHSSSDYTIRPLFTLDVPTHTMM